MLVYQDGNTVGTIGGGAMESIVVQVARESVLDGRSRIETYVLNNLEDGDPGICGGTARIFIEPLSIAPTLLVIGGGHVGKATAELGKWLGYRVVLCDDRAEYANAEYIAGLDDYVVCSPADVPAKIDITSRMYIVAVTRGLPIDEILLPALLQSDASYIGLIGSRRRWAITMNALREQGITDVQLQRIHAPIGLEIEAESPREIAISILAEVTMIRRGGTGQPMKWHGKLQDVQ